MEVLVRVRAVHYDGFRFERIEMKHLRLAVIEPDERVKVIAHE
jgi:hypothetical protein